MTIQSSETGNQAGGDKRCKMIGRNDTRWLTATSGSADSASFAVSARPAFRAGLFLECAVVFIPQEVARDTVVDDFPGEFFILLPFPHDPEVRVERGIPHCLTPRKTFQRNFFQKVGNPAVPS